MDSSFPFAEFCSFLDKARRSRTASSRKTIVQSFLNHWRKSDPDCYPVLRLLIPSYDSSRSYNMKEAKLANVLIKVLSLAKGSADAMLLRRFEHLQGDKKRLGKEEEDFGDAVFKVVKGRLVSSDPESGSRVTVKRVNDFLTQLSESVSDKKEDLLSKFITTLTPMELAWLVRIILKAPNLIRIPDVHVLKAYHESAPQLYNVTGDLRRVARELWDPDRILQDIQVRIGEPFSPMLADRVASFSGLGNKIILEEKLDGERLLLHVLPDGTLKCFSRSLQDSSDLYRAGFLKNLQLNSFENSVFDGELMAFDADLDIYLNYDTVRMAASQAAQDPDSRVYPVFIVFDLSFLHGVYLGNEPLLVRKEKLKELQTLNCKQMKIIEYKEFEDYDEQLVMAELDAVMAKHGEGLILKAANSKYEIGARSKQWIKVKPDYVNGLIDTFDLQVTGVYVGKGVLGTTGTISALQCACTDPYSGKLLSFCKIGSGFNREELRTIHSMLSAHLTTERPEDLLESPRGDYPDAYIDTQAFKLIVEVQGMSIIDSGVFACGLTLRSPRFLRLRPDLSSPMTIVDIQAMRHVVKSSKVSADSTIIVELKDENVIVKDYFKGEPVYVHEGNQNLTVEGLKDNVKRLNGTPVSAPNPQQAPIKHIIASSFDHPGMRLRAIMRAFPDAKQHTIKDILLSLKE